MLASLMTNKYKVKLKNPINQEFHNKVEEHYQRIRDRKRMSPAEKRLDTINHKRRNAPIEATGSIELPLAQIEEKVNTPSNVDTSKFLCDNIFVTLGCGIEDVQV